MKTESILNVSVTGYKNYEDIKGGAVNLLEWLTRVPNSEEIELIKKIKLEKDKTKRDALKAKLPCITPSGIFLPTRSIKNLSHHSGWICVDVDYAKANLEIENFEDLKTQFAKINQVAFCAKSVSGQGWFILIKIAYPQKHLQHFLAIQRIFNSLGIAIDISCKDVSRLRGFSGDAEVYVNHAATVLKTFDVPVKALKTSNRSHVNSIECEAAIVESYLDEIETFAIDITGTYTTWLSICFDLASTFGEGGRSYFQRCSQFHEDYSETECDNKFDSCLAADKEPSLGAFINACKAAKVQPSTIRHKTSAAEDFAVPYAD